MFYGNAESVAVNRNLLVVLEDLDVVGIEFLTVHVERKGIVEAVVEENPVVAFIEIRGVVEFGVCLVGAAEREVGYVAVLDVDNSVFVADDFAHVYSNYIVFFLNIEANVLESAFGGTCYGGHHIFA